MLNFTRTVVCCLALAAVPTSTEAGEAIAYRLSETKEMHFDDGRKAELHLAAVKKLGCEARLDSHDGHSDVIYRSTRWQSMEVATDTLAHQWEDWLKKAGFETVHGHAADHGTGHDARDGHDHSGHDHDGHSHGPGEAEQVAYQLPRWKTIYVEDERQVPELVALMKGLGCEVRSEERAGRAGLSVRCTTWKHIEFDSHRAAAGWEDWLKKKGFITRHEH